MADTVGVCAPISLPEAAIGDKLWRPTTFEGKTLGQTHPPQLSRFFPSFISNLCHSLNNGRWSQKVCIPSQMPIFQLTISFSFPPVRACLFDMDGLLIDSEDIYTDITNKILHSFGKPSLPWAIKAQLQGRPQPDVHNPLTVPTSSLLPRPRLRRRTHRILTKYQAAKIFHHWAQLPIPHEEYHKRQGELQAELFPTTQPLPGVETLLAKLLSTQKTSNPVHIALATSSHNRNYHLKTSHLQDLFSLFPDSQRVLGDDPRIGKGRGKPLPDIYLLALETINAGLRERGEKEIAPEECLVFEDAVPGVEAGRRAGMRVIWCPHPGLLGAYKGREAEVLAGLTGEHKEAEKSVSEKEADELTAERLQSAGKPGHLNDGFAEVLSTLQDFPYERYGIQPADA